QHGVECRLCPSAYRLPLGYRRLERGVSDHEVPDNSLERLRVGRHGFRIDCGDDDASVGDLRGVATVAPDDAEDGAADVFGVLQRLHEIRADVLLEVPAAHGHDEDHVVRAQVADL